MTTDAIKSLQLVKPAFPAWRLCEAFRDAGMAARQEAFPVFKRYWAALGSLPAAIAG